MFQLKLDNIPFTSGNPNLAPTIHGTISLFKRRKDLDSSAFYDGTLLPKIRAPLVLLPLIPSFISVQELMQFLACVLENVKWMKLLYDDHPKRYMALILFRDASYADSFYAEFSGQRYSSFGDAVCNICFVDEVRIHESDGYWKIIKWDPNAEQIREWREEEGNENPFPLPLYDDQVVQLPTCPVCLEYLDSEVSGIITTYCSHDFHIKCLERWGDACPVCRYSGDEANANCKTCGSINNLWMCLICGNIGCGRYEQGHAKDHFMQTDHTFAMNMSTKNVWDYKGDKYVHRVIESQLEKEMGSSFSGKNCDNDILEATFASKIDALAEDYNKLLNQHLTKQRIYFESRIRDIEHEYQLKIHEKDSHIQTLKEKLKQPPELTKKQEKRIQELEKEKSLLNQLNERLIANQKSFVEEKKSLEREYEERISKLEGEIQELREFNKQLLIHLETQASIQTSDAKEDIQGGQLLIMKTGKKKKPRR